MSWHEVLSRTGERMQCVRTHWEVAGEETRMGFTEPVTSEWEI